MGIGGRAKGLGEHLKTVDAQGDLAAAAAKDGSVDSDEVAEIEGGEPLEGVGPEDVETGVQLDLAAAVVQVDEGGSAGAAAGGDPPGDAVEVLGFLTGGEVGVGVEDLAGGLYLRKSIWEVLTAR
jgi:hypothetical protein